MPAFWNDALKRSEGLNGGAAIVAINISDRALIEPGLASKTRNRPALRDAIGANARYGLIDEHDGIIRDMPRFVKLYFRDMPRFAI
jgi:hypothetical protein